MNTFLGYTVSELFDPVQTHVVKGVPDDQVIRIKRQLTVQYNATRFRTVATEIDGMSNVCFKMDKS